MGYAYVVAPGDRRQRRRWFPLAGRIPEGLLGRAGRIIPWRGLAVLAPPGEGRLSVPAGLVVGLPVSAAGLAEWAPELRRRHLDRVVEELAARDVRWIGSGLGLPSGAGGTETLGEAVRDVWGGTGSGAAFVPEWAGRLAGALTAAERLAAVRGLDSERAEVVVWGAESAAGRIVARSLARRFGRLTLAGFGPPLQRLADQILHESGTAVRVSGEWRKILARAELVVAASPLPPGLVAETVRPPAGVVDATQARVLFAWPAGSASAEVPGAVWRPGLAGGALLATAGVAALAAVAAVGDPGSAAGSAVSVAVSGGEPTLYGIESVRKAVSHAGLQAVAVLDKAGVLLL